MYQYRRIIISGIAALLVLSMLAGLIVMIVQAKSSDEIQGEIDSLQEQAEQLASDREALNDEIAANQEKTLSIVEQKSQLDRDIELTQQEIENTGEQIHQYSCLIAEKQAELDELEQEQSDLLQHYKLRMRTIQERGGISRWAVILHAADFADMLNRRAMVEEIAASDQRMMDELRSVAEKVVSAKEELAAQKTVLEQKRTELGEKLDLIEKDAYRFCYVNDFPMFELDPETKQIGFTHNPFSMPQGGLEALNTMDPLEILAYQYDIVCNGVELSSGAVRNHDIEIMKKAFVIAGYDEETLKTKFGALYQAFQFGAPPHAGMAPGVDRMIMLLCNEENIREVIAFPMSGSAQDLMCGAPNDVTEQQLREVHIKVRD